MLLHKVRVNLANICNKVRVKSPISCNKVRVKCRDYSPAITEVIKPARQEQAVSAQRE
jgi:hypothetical protein